MFDLDLDDGEIGFLVGADHFGVVLNAWGIVLEANADAIGFFDDVTVGKNVTLRIDDHSGTQRAFTDRAAIGAGTLATGASEEMVEEVFHSSSSASAAFFVILAPALIAAIAAT